jgi:hypothetical protein
VAAAAAAVSAARIAVEQEQQQGLGVGVGGGGGAAGEAVLQAQQQQQQQVEVRVGSGFGGASQAAVFTKLDVADAPNVDSTTITTLTASDRVGSGADDVAAAAGGQSSLLRVVWGPQFAAMTVGEVAGGAAGSSGEAAVGDDVPVEHL